MGCACSVGASPPRSRERSVPDCDAAPALVGPGTNAFDLLASFSPIVPNDGAVALKDDGLPQNSSSDHSSVDEEPCEQSHHVDRAVERSCASAPGSAAASGSRQRANLSAANPLRAPDDGAVSPAAESRSCADALFSLAESPALSRAGRSPSTSFHRAWTGIAERRAYAVLHRPPAQPPVTVKQDATALEALAAKFTPASVTGHTK
eukprot:CAMPEP_0174838658 /NCGR_PEP_ID=MMETSP1114-20130205/7530_1 /TAXON_ID=312471 /ORGANISM="Neobodo designis, Strain CCAP 1951/1" /LENGTH=205 /DNA_ID=CAMNT_0016072761 /DNA_START=43 /DNA_END=660 /DNA_ORIENTATION=+